MELQVLPAEEIIPHCVPADPESPGAALSQAGGRSHLVGSGYVWVLSRYGNASKERDELFLKLDQRQKDKGQPMPRT